MARYVDLTLPGKYRVVLTAGKIRSNAVFVTVLPPRVIPPSHPALTVARGALLQWSRAGKGIQIRCRPVVHTTAPEVTVYIRNTGGHAVPIRFSGDPVADFGRIQVTGPRPPNAYGLVRHLKPGQQGKLYVPPTPVPPNLKGKWYLIPYPDRKAAPLTAYGQWLAKHPPKGPKWKTYMLKPGVVYKYAVTGMIVAVLLSAS